MAEDQMLKWIKAYKSYFMEDSKPACPNCGSGHIKVSYDSEQDGAGVAFMECLDCKDKVNFCRVKFKGRFVGERNVEIL